MMTRRLIRQTFAILLIAALPLMTRAGEILPGPSVKKDDRIPNLLQQIQEHEAQRKAQDDLAKGHQKVMQQLETLDVAVVFSATTNAERNVLIDELERAITMPAEIVRNAKVLWQQERECKSSIERNKQKARTILLHLENPSNQTVVLVSRVRSQEDPARVAEWKFEIAKKEKKIKELLATRAEAHPLVQQLRKEVKALRERVALYPDSARRDEQMTVRTNLQNTTLKRELADVKLAIQTDQQRLVDIRQELLGVRDQIARFVRKAQERHQTAAGKALEESKLLTSKIAATTELLEAAKREQSVVTAKPVEEKECSDESTWVCSLEQVLKWGAIALGCILFLIGLVKVLRRVRAGGRNVSGIDKATGLQVLGHVPQFDVGKAGE